MKSLVLAEKPAVAREIARVLGCSKKAKGYLEGSAYVVTWALGHLVELAEPEDYDDKYKQWKLEDLPMLPEPMKLKVIRQTSHQFRVVRELMKRKDVGEMIIATDAGREGELVARWIMVLGQWKKPFKRLWISSQTDAAIKEGFANLKPGHDYDPLFDAAVCRAEADWLIGLNMTRALSCKFNAQLNAGRVQTPTLSMIVQREEEIRQFVPQDYWTLKADFGEYFGQWRGKTGIRIFDQQKALDLQNKVANQTGQIVELTREVKKEPPPLAYDLTELQRDANRRFNWSAQKTLQILQGLYERHKIVSYPRTDSRYISSDIVPTLPSRLQAVAVGSYREMVQEISKKKLTLGKRLVDNSKVSDHHAIIPTEQPVDLNRLDPDERKLHDLIVRRFLAVLSSAYIYEQLTLVTEVKDERFYSKGKTVQDLGWRAVTSVKKEGDLSDELPEQTLGQMNQGEQRLVKAAKISKSKTKPPARYSEATLLTAMENPGKFIEDEELRESMKGSGLGTPATRAEIIEKLLYTNYIERNGKELLPTSKGLQLIKLVVPELRSPELTARWEQSLTDIARGRGSKEKFLSAIRRNAKTMVQMVENDQDSTYKADNVTRQKCPVCGKYMLLMKGKRGRMLVCQDRACGYRQPEKENEEGFKTSRKASQMNQKLIRQYSDKGNLGNNLGDLLKAALEKEQ